MRKTEDAVRNRWLRIRKEEGGGLTHLPDMVSPQTCRVCGKPRRGHICKLAKKTSAVDKEDSENIDVWTPIPDIPLFFPFDEKELRMLWQAFV